MKLRFSIHYRTEWGQQLVVALRHTLVDGSERIQQLPMQTVDGDFWTLETQVVDNRQRPITSFSYVYLVVDSEGRELRREWDLVERAYPCNPTNAYTLPDEWRDRPLPYHLYSRAYRVTMGEGSTVSVPVPPLPTYRKTLLFRVSAPQLLDGQSLAIVGSHPILGSWNPAHFLPMQPLGRGDWGLTVNVDWIGGPMEYKYVVVDDVKHELALWEDGDNRTIDPQLEDGEVLVLHGGLLRLAERTWRAAGVGIPLFSLRSQESCGVGDFGDLCLLVDWAASVGMKTIQLLPVNDTTCSHGWGDSYPYNLVSAFALHPQYIDLRQLGPLADKRLMTAHRRQQQELNALSYTDYEAVDRVKHRYVALRYAEDGRQTLATKECRQWQEQNAHWLRPYAAWLAKKNVGGDLSEGLVVYTQYHLHQQLLHAANYARSKGVFLKGDLPIGVNRDSAETAQHPSFFHLDSQTGAPPDAFSHQGQNWGFPTYAWDADATTSAAHPAVDAENLTTWFRSRLAHLAQYFDALRIDHVLGFFRIWEIPQEQVHGTMGHFRPALPLTAGEIEYFGLPFRRDFLTHPFINDRILERLFGIHANYARDTYLISQPYGLYRLRPEVNTQQLVMQAFEGRSDENSLWIRDGLLRLVSNVLFLEDPRQPEMYHPRIQAYQEPVFDALGNDERDAYMRIYNNYFYQRHSTFWGAMGYRRLSEIFSSTPMLVCAEDLGMLPDCVAPVLDALRILTLEIQQMPKQSGVEFAHLEGNPQRSVCTLSTHDMAPLRLWWQEQPDRTQRYYTTMLQKQGHAPEQLPSHLAEEIVARHLYCPSMLCILSLQDWLAIDGELRAKNPRDERINVPSDPYNQWKWRMHIDLETLMKAERFNQKVRTMIQRSKR